MVVMEDDFPPITIPHRGEGMAKTMPAQGASIERADWVKDDYVVALMADKTKTVDNPFYQDEEKLHEKYGEPEKGERYWLVEKKGEVKKVYPDFPEDAKQFSLVFEVLDGEKHGDWLFVYCSPRYYKKKDGKWGGKRAEIVLSAKPDFDLESGLEDDWSDIDGVPLRANVEPQTNPQYGKATGFMPLKKGYVAPSRDIMDAPDIPF
jgi:hypothetical protein